VNVLSTTTAGGRIGHCRTQDAGTLLECLATLGLSSEEGERLLSFGAVYHGRARVTSNRVLSPGEYVRVHLQPKRFPVEKVDWPATIIYQNDRFVVVNKPAGIPVHATVDNVVENVLHLVSLTLRSPIHITQRLDTEVSGVLVLAKTKEFQRQFNQLLIERRVRKRYRALVERTPELGRHVHYMKPAKRSPKLVQPEPRHDWLECVLHVDGVTRIPGASHQPPLFEVEIDLETGRTHQIRAQLSALGSPIAGDELYGSTKSCEVSGPNRRRIALASTSTSWTDEEGRAWSFALAADF
jgi:23S rRNA pseudouridine1911/1915/1917 synthase